MSSSSSQSSEAKAPITVEQVIGECFVRTAQTILTSRIQDPPSRNNEQRRRSTWFKLDLEELESATAPLDRWRRDPSLPLVVEIYLSSSPSSSSSNTILLERWVIHYKPSLPDPSAAAGGGGLSRSQMARISPQSVYKRLTIMLRSLYSYVRILPAYRIYRASSCALSYKLHSTLPSKVVPTVPALASTASRRGLQQQEQQHFEFSSVDTAYAQLKVSVDYQPSSAVKALLLGIQHQQQQNSPVFAPQIIPNYVGSSRLSPTPTAAAEVTATTPRRQSWSSSARWGVFKERLQSVTSAELSSSPLHPQDSLGLASSPAVAHFNDNNDDEASLPLIVDSSSSPLSLPLPPPISITTTNDTTGRRVTSAPVTIPSSGGHQPAARQRRMMSSHELGALDTKNNGNNSNIVAGDNAARQNTSTIKPLSAPAVSHMPTTVADTRRRSSDHKTVTDYTNDDDHSTTTITAAAQEADPYKPPPELIIPISSNECSSLASVSSSSLAAAFPASCSPDLPFAFTPTARSASGFLRTTRTSTTSQPETPREQQQQQGLSLALERMDSSSSSSALALVRRSSPLNPHPTTPSHSNEAGTGQSVKIGYSVSPLQDVPGLDSILSASTPRQMFYSSSFHGSGAFNNRAGSHHVKQQQQRGPLRLLTFQQQPDGSPSKQSPLEETKNTAHYPLHKDDATTVMTPVQSPFELHQHHYNNKDSNNALLSPSTTDIGGATVITTTTASTTANVVDKEEEEDVLITEAASVNVGAFVRLLQEAPPLEGAHSVSLESGLHQLDLLKERLYARGVAL